MLRHGRRTSKATGLALSLLVGVLTTACGPVLPEHPGDESLVLGFRVTDQAIEVKVPVCAGEKLSRVEVWDPGDETKKERLLWWAEGPQDRSADHGLLRLWSPDDYRKASTAGKPSPPPPRVDVSVTYAGQDDSVGDLVDLGEAAKHQPANEFWTIKGHPMTAEEIDGQLSCPAERAGLRR
ncbi:hypothetical protein ACIGEZ_27600 [Streptomyces sp. NPDC085481]|uniref:hypothetical protein n=1 Tax=Streptomyces sp. NPDC085481 TaxID=3365727 RepID=UPI0037D46349